MEGYIFDIADIFRQVYGYTPARVPGLPAVAEGNDYTVGTREQRPMLNGLYPVYGLQDMIGREVFLPIVIEAGGVNYEFPFAVMGLTNRAIIVETPMVERGASVIEEIGVESWKISVKGFLIDALGQFPDDQLARLNQMWRRREPVRLKCALSDLFLTEDDSVVITQLAIPEKPKVVGVRDFAFECIQNGVLDLYATE